MTMACENPGVGPLDGGTGQTPLDLDGIADVGRLVGLLATRGYSSADIDNFYPGNFVNFLRRSPPVA